MQTAPRPAALTAALSDAARRNSMLAALLLVGSATCCLAGQNMLANPELSNFTTSPWIASQGTVYLSNLDHANDLDSGSARLAHPASFVGSLLLSECVTIQGGGPADVGGYFRTTAGNGAGSKMRIGRFYYSDSSCQSYISGVNSGYFVAPSSWTSVTSSSTAPANAKSVRMEVVAASTTAYEAFDLLADGLYLNAVGESAPSALFTDDFESGSCGHWSATQ